MPEPQDMFQPYQGAPVTSQCYKELGQKMQRCSQPEREGLFESFQPKELHLQLLKLTVARTSGCQRPLLDALKEECKFLSKFSLKSKLLFCGNNTELLDTNVLIPMLQTVSASTRNRILWNLGKHISTGINSEVSETHVDAIYTSVSKVWGSNIALPLLCQTSKEVLERELQRVTRLSNGQLLVIANKNPFLALSFLEKQCRNSELRKAARCVVRKTMPKSFDYIVKQDSSFLSKSMMKIILKDHFNVIMESPSSWLNVLDKRTVKKVLSPKDFGLFLAKQMMELKNLNVPFTLFPYFEMLPRNEVSSILNNVFPEKYGCPLRSKLDFWEKNVSLLKLLDTSDRSFVAVELNTKNPLSTCWLPLMAADISIPRIKKILSVEQDGRARARLVSLLIETALLNKDQSAIEDICTFVLSRYRNDKVVIQCFFNSDLDFSSLSAETFEVVFAAAERFYSADDWQSHCAAKLFPLAVKRNWGEPALKEYLQQFMKGTRCFTFSALADLENKLRLVCVEEIFTTANIENRNVLRQLAAFLHLITKWTPSSSSALITDNVKECVLTLLKSDIDRHAAVAFVCANLNSLNIKFVEDCFQYVPNPIMMAYLFRKKSYLVSSEDTLKRIGKHIVDKSVRGFVGLLTKFKKLGYTDVLGHLAAEGREALAVADADKLQNYTNAVVLLVLTTPADDFFSAMDPLLPSTEDNKVDKSKGDGSNAGRYSSLRASKREDAVYYGFGMSISHLETPASALDGLRRFCVSGDLILFVRDGVYSVSSFLPNEKAKMFLVSLMRQPVSVKKHALRLLRRAVCNIETQEVLLLQLMESEEHLTMRIILMDTAFSLLNTSKYPSMWQVVKTMINKLTPDDKTIVLEIANRRVPDPFLEEFYQILLEKCKTLKDVENTSVINGVIQSVSQVATLVSEDFVESLIAEYFLSETFFGQVHSHSATVELVLGYLRGAPASKLPANRRDNVAEPRKDVIGRRQFLEARLNASAMYGPLDVFDSVQGFYPVRRLLMMFIEHLCSACLVRHSETTHEHRLTEYIDFLLSYFDRLSPNSVIGPSMWLSLTKVMDTEATAFELGRKIGEFCDSTFRKSSAALFCYFPDAVARFVDAHAVQSSRFSSGQLVDLLSGMLSTVPPGCGAENTPEDSCNTLRVVTVVHILPPQWLVADEYEDFRRTFLALVKNTPVEEFLFNAG